MKNTLLIIMTLLVTNLYANKIELSKTETEPIKKLYTGYYSKIEEKVIDNLFVFIDYSEVYRPSGFELEQYTLTLGDESFRAYKPRVFFSNKVKENIENYQANQSMKFLYEVKTQTEYNLYFFEDGSLKLRAEFKQSDIVNGKINLHPALNLYERGKAGAVIDKPAFVLIPADKSSRIDEYSKPAELELKYVPVKGLPYDAQTEDQFGPAQSMYGTRPGVVTVKNNDGTLCIGYQETGKNIFHFLELDADCKLKRDIAVEMKMNIFGGFAKDEEGNYFLVVAKDNQDGDFTSNVHLLKIDASGKETASFKLDIDREHHDVKLPLSFSSSRVVYGNGHVAVHMGKTQHKNKHDGLNHQSAILFVVDAKTMQLNKDLSAVFMASHSFDQRMIFDGTDFVNLDLADNFPRGFSIHKPAGSKVIFTYKTAHFKGQNRSNDNNTYSELGGLADSEHGYVVLGSSEKTFDNSKTGTNLNEARNLFMLLVAKDFPSKKGIMVEGKVHNNMVSSEVVITNAPPSKQIFFYDYVGGKNYQQQRGVVWLTNYTDVKTENATRPKLVKLDDDKFMAIWEKWKDASYDGTYYMIFNAKGTILKEAAKIGPFRLSRGDDVIAYNGKALWVTGQKSQQNLKIHILGE